MFQFTNENKLFIIYMTSENCVFFSHSAYKKRNYATAEAGKERKVCVFIYKDLHDRD